MMNPAAAFQFETHLPGPTPAVELASAAVSKARQSALTDVHQQAYGKDDRMDGYVRIGARYLNARFRSACTRNTKNFLVNTLLPLAFLLYLMAVMAWGTWTMLTAEPTKDVDTSLLRGILLAVLAVDAVLLYFGWRAIRDEILPGVRQFYAGISDGDIEMLKSEAAIVWAVGKKGIHIWGRFTHEEVGRPARTIRYDMISEVRKFENSDGGYGLMILDQAGHVCCTMEDVRDSEKAVEMLKARAGC